MSDPTLIGHMNCSQGAPQFQFTQSEGDEFCARLDDLENTMVRILSRLEAVSVNGPAVEAHDHATLSLQRSNSMVRYTIQLHSLSGSFGSPEGTDVKYARTLADVRWIMLNWADEHDKVGAERQDAHALVWPGAKPDVTDLCPWFELTIGPRDGIRRQNC